MRPVPAVLAAAGVAIVAVALQAFRPSVPTSPATPPAAPPLLALTGVPAAEAFEIAVEPPPEPGGSRQDRIEVTSAVLYPAHDLRTGVPRGHFIQVGGRAILSRATCDALRPSLREVAMNVPRIPVFSFGAVLERQPLVRISERAIERASPEALFADEPSMPSSVPGPLFYWPGSARGREAAVTVGLVRGVSHDRLVRMPGAMPAFVCSADIRLPADVVARCEVVPVAEVGDTVAKADGDDLSYETEIRLPGAWADIVRCDAGSLRAGRACDGVEEARAVCRDDARGPGALKITTRKPGPFDAVEIVTGPSEVRVRLKVVSLPD